MQSQDKENTFTFLCPMTQENERINVCLFRKRKKWMGQEIASSICACAMDAGKCAAVEMQKDEGRQGRAMAYTDNTSKISRIPAEILAKVKRCIATITMMGRYPDLSHDQRERLSTSDLSETPAKAGRGKKKIEKDDILIGADTDMSASLNKALDNDKI